MEEPDGSDVYCCVHFGMRGGNRAVGACVRRRNQRSGEEDAVQWNLELYDFLDNEQFSNFDCFLVQVGSCVLLAPEDLEDESKADHRKLRRILDGRSSQVSVQFVKKSMYKKGENQDLLRKIVGKESHEANVAEIERPEGYLCLGCLNAYLKLAEEDISGDGGYYRLHLGSLTQYMRLDSAAVEAVNLLPRPDHPSQFGSLFGVLNRCKTKMGQRLLERWLRQPLVDADEINRRLDVVSALKESTSLRLEMIDGPMKNAPDLDAILSKLQRKNAGLGELYRVYAFSRTLPRLVGVLQSLIDDCAQEGTKELLRERFLRKAEMLVDKLSKYQRLVEHVVDFERLPDLEVNPMHDPELAELRAESDSLEDEVARLHDEARSGWASFTDVKLERNGHQGVVFRTTRPDDERQLRAKNSNVQIVSILKNGLYFTTPQLKRVAERTKQISSQYSQLQSAVVDKAVDTARTYTPLIESASALIAELDVLCSFAAAAALAAVEYVRPVVHPLGTGKTRILKGRHPCVELMDAVEFIPNDCILDKASSNFQIITGPNMGGKSTYIRSIGCIQVMAQVGSFVPCASAEISVADTVLARVGAGDAVQKGVSTFMAEMLEASVILQTATPDSLIIIDELGRGTSTFDGFGLAWAISEYIVTRIGASTLFATHFHELTTMSATQSRVANKHVTAYTENNQVIMLHTVRDGACSESFGIHVAGMAHFPAAVLAEARRKAASLEALEQIGVDHETEAIAKRRRLVTDAMDSFVQLGAPPATTSSSDTSLAQKNYLSSVSSIISSVDQ